MKLVTFRGASREERIGALAADGWIVDLNAAYASYLRIVEREGAFYALANARVPSNMRGLFENGDRGLDAARTAFELATKGGPEMRGASGESIFFRREAVSIKASSRKSFSILLEISANITRKRKNRDFPIRCSLGLCFFRMWMPSSVQTSPLFIQSI
jgi:hypothetical protein